MLPAMQGAGEVSPGVTMTISGAADQLDATRDSLSENLVVAVILIYLLLVAIFTHWGYPLLILATVPLGIAGGLVGLVSINGLGNLFGGFHQPFDMITMLGFVIFIGHRCQQPHSHRRPRPQCGTQRPQRDRRSARGRCCALAANINVDLHNNFWLGTTRLYSRRWR